MSGQRLSVNALSGTRSSLASVSDPAPPKSQLKGVAEWNEKPNCDANFRRPTLEEKQILEQLQEDERHSHRRDSQDSNHRLSKMSRALAANNLSHKSTVVFEGKEESEKKPKKKTSKVSKNKKEESKEENRENENGNGGNETAIDWNAEGPDILSDEYLKGLNQRLFLGGPTNLNEHKKLIRDLQILRSQRQQQVHKNEHLMTKQRQKIMKGKEDFQNKIAAAQKTKKGKKKVKKAAPPISLPPLFNPQYTHRKTQVSVNEIALLAKGQILQKPGINGEKKFSRLGHIIAGIIHQIPARLFLLGIIDEEEGKAAELLLEIKDKVDMLKNQESKLSLATAQSSMDGEIQAIIMANRRREIVESIIEATQKKMESKIMTRKRSTDVKAANVTAGSEEDPDQVMRTLEMQSKLLQSHPFVAQAILLCGKIPQNLGGLGGRDFGREEKAKIIPKKSEDSEDSEHNSFDLLQQEETKKGYCTVLGLLRATNMLETKCVQDRISQWCRQTAEETAAKKRARTKFKPGMDLIPLRNL